MNNVPESADAAANVTETAPRCITSSTHATDERKIDEAAAEGLLLLQHVSGTSDSTVMKSPLQNESPENRTDATSINPIHQLLQNGSPMRLSHDVFSLGFFRGVFKHGESPNHYALIRYKNEIHSLGFYTTSVAAAHAWDLAAIKRSMELSLDLSMSKTHFKLEDYIRLENIMSLMVVLSFEELVEMFKDANPSIQNLDATELEQKIQELKKSSEDEIGNVAIPAELKDNAFQGDFPSKALSPDEMRDIISSSCGKRLSHNTWVKNIRNSKKWKGVYFSRDGVPYSKVEFGGKYHYLGRFDTLEGAARAYDLATLKRAMMNNQSIVSLNFAVEDYTKDRQLMEFLFAADSEQVSRFIRMLAHNQRSYASNDGYGRGRPGSKRQKLDIATLAAFSSWDAKPAETTVQHIDWESLALGTDVTTPPSQPINVRSYGNDHEETTEGFKNQEMKVERRICDAKMAALLQGSKSWVRIALNAVALKMTPSNIVVTGDKATFPSDVAEWFGSLTNDIEGPHVVELSNAYGEQIFHFTCYISQEKDHCRFSEKAWNQFVDEIGLTVGDILVLLKSNTLWKLSYTVFVLPDALMGTAFSQTLPLPQPPSLPRAPASAPVRMPRISPPLTPQRPPLSSGRTCQAYVMSSAESLKNIKILQKTQDGRLLVEAEMDSNPLWRGLFVIPYNSILPSPLPLPNGYNPNLNRNSYPSPNKNYAYGIAPTSLPTRPRYQTPQPRLPVQNRPAVLPSAPIRLNLCSGFKALAKKADASLFMVADSTGQVRLVTSQPSASGGGILQPVAYTQASDIETAVGYPTHFFQRESRSAPTSTPEHSPHSSQIVDALPRRDIIPEKASPPEEDTTIKQVINLVDDEEKDLGKESELPRVYSQVREIIENCSGLDGDIVKKYKFAFINKMTPGQQIANCMELQKLSQSGKMAEVMEWIKETVDNSFA